MKYLFSYDIKNSKRSAKIRKKFEQLGYSVQKSIYTFSISDSEADSLTTEILSILNIKEDRLAVYRICVFSFAPKGDFVRKRRASHPERIGWPVRLKTEA